MLSWKAKPNQLLHNEPPSLQTEVFLWRGAALLPSKQMIMPRSEAYKANNVSMLSWKAKPNQLLHNEPPSLQTEVFFMARCCLVAKQANDNAAKRGLQGKQREYVKLEGKAEPAVT